MIEQRWVGSSGTVKVRTSGLPGGIYDDKKITEAWKEYLDHLHKWSPGEAENLQWAEKREEFLVNLLSLMSQSLGYKFDRVEIKNSCYAPQHFLETHLKDILIRDKLCELLNNQRLIKVEVTSSTESEKDIPENKEEMVYEDGQGTAQ